MIRIGAVLSVVVVAFGLLAAGVVAGSLLVVVVSIAVAALAMLMLIAVAVIWRHEIFSATAADQRVTATEPPSQMQHVAVRAPGPVAGTEQSASAAEPARNGRGQPGRVARAEHAEREAQAPVGRKSAHRPAQDGEQAVDPFRPLRRASREVAAAPGAGPERAGREVGEAEAGQPRRDERKPDRETTAAAARAAGGPPADQRTVRSDQHAGAERGASPRPSGATSAGPPSPSAGPPSPSAPSPSAPSPSAPSAGPRPAAAETTTPRTEARPAAFAADRADRRGPEQRPPAGRPADEQVSPAVRLIDAAAARAQAAVAKDAGPSGPEGRPEAKVDYLGTAAVGRPAERGPASRLERESARAARTARDSGRPDAAEATERTADRSAERPARNSGPQGTGPKLQKPSAEPGKVSMMDLPSPPPAAPSAAERPSGTKPAGGGAAAGGGSGPATSAAAQDQQRPGGAESGSGGESGSTGKPDGGTVSVVPGIARYHRSDCLLIRFLSADDLDVLSKEAAVADGCVPCKACRPDDLKAGLPVN